MINNSHLCNANRKANNEFYTRYIDIDPEIRHYEKYLENKIVYCNCDSKESNFYKYFLDNFSRLGLSKLICTHYKTDYPPPHKRIFDGHNLIETEMDGNGDYSSPECIQILKESDIVITNPPFSKIKEFIFKMLEYEKPFLIIGPMNVATYRDVFPLFQKNIIKFGYTSVKKFIKPDGGIQEFGNIYWLTNLDVVRKPLNMMECPIISKYACFDNYPAINVDTLKAISMNYQDTMGVPITFLLRYDPAQFEIIGFRKGLDGKDLRVDGKDKFARVLIKRKNHSFL